MIANTPSYELKKSALMGEALNPLQELQDLVDQGLQPSERLVWFGLGFRPPKQNAIALFPDFLPSKVQCRAVCGLDVIVLFNRYLNDPVLLKRLRSLLIQGRPYRLQLYDLDTQTVEFFKLRGGQ
jgi:hypothetical protein